MLRWLVEVLFIVAGCVTGAASQLLWFTGTRSGWEPYRDSLYAFSMTNAWDKHHMTVRLLLGSALSVVLFYVVRKCIRALIRRHSLFDPIRERYLKYDTLSYTIFLFASLAVLGFYTDLVILFLIFLAAQIYLLFRLAGSEIEQAVSKACLGHHRLLALFAVSGFAALIYQIVWQRLLFLSYGVSIESVTIIVSIFMFGLGVGSIAGGILSRKFPEFLPHLFVACEAAIGIFGLVSLKVLQVVTEATLQSSLMGVSMATYGILFIPTLFMGATLPVLVSHLYNYYENVGESVSLLYFVNTIGSAVAGFLTVQALFHFVGLSASILLAAGCNFAVGYFGFRYIKAGMSYNQALGENRQRAGAAEPAFTPRRGRYVLVLALSGFIGFVSLGQEILWVRIISYATATEASVFGNILGCFLMGIAFGALRARKLIVSLGDGIVRGIGGLLLVVAIAYYALIPALGFLASVIGDGAIPVMYLGVGLISFFSGAIFPLLTHYAITSRRTVGFSVSWIYFANIVGSTSGAVVIGFFFLEWMTLTENVLIISGLTFVVGAGLWLSSGPVSTRHGKYVFGSAIAVLLIMLSHDALYSHLLERFYFKHKYARREAFAHTVQNRSGIINVIPMKTGDDKIIGGGKYDGRFNTSLLNNGNGIDRAYMVAAFHPQPRDVLSIGLSGGSWAMVLAGHSEVNSLTILEINRGYLEIIPHYAQVSQLLHDDKVSIHIDDGRRWLKRNPDSTFDFILMNTTFHWRSQVNNLVSREFLTLCKQHLKPGGVIFYNGTGSWDVPYTAAHVFEHVISYGDFIAASDRPFPTDVDLKRENLLKFEDRDEAVFAPDNANLQGILQMLASTDTENKRAEILDESDLSVLITDDNLASEFKSGRKLYSGRRSWLPLLGYALSLSWLQTSR